jgi:membrane protease YdiL (CAAX protease family)
VSLVDFEEPGSGERLRGESEPGAGEPSGPGEFPVVAARRALAARRPISEIPSLGQALLFFLMMVPVLAGGQYGALFVAQRLHLFGARPMQAYLELAASDARLGLPAQALAYLLVAGCGAWLFSFAWQRPFLVGVHWRGKIAAGRAWWLVGLGLAGGLASSLIGNLLPMPKDPPILMDMMHSPVGAWMMLVFGVTFAPALEEMAFRGFLLPGFVHAFDWLVRKGDITVETRRWVGVPVSVVLTSVPFALMHAPQVSHAWGPLVLIGLISVMLCVVRLLLDSLAASVLVHAAYNLTLFLGILVETGGFRHLDKLSG